MLCLEPDYLEKFVCDGQRCGAQCCRLWSVSVDSLTYERYKGLPQEKSRELLERLMPGDENQAPWVWDFGQEQTCHFLRGDFFCGIQKEHGEEFLGSTCAIYPRKPVNIGGSCRMSLSLSCPLAAELALFRGSPVKFQWKERDNVRPESWQKIACHQGDEGLAASCLLLQDTGLKILQLKLPLTERLTALIAYLAEADKAVEAGDFQQLLQVSDEYGQGGGQRAEDFDWHLDRHFPGLREALAVPESKNQHLQGLHRIKAKGTLPALELILENILVSEYFVELFPCTLGGTLEHNGRAFLALAMLYREALEEAWGDLSEMLYKVNRISTLMGHDKNWQETLSQNTP